MAWDVDWVDLGIGALLGQLVAKSVPLLKEGLYRAGVMPRPRLGEAYSAGNAAMAWWTIPVEVRGWWLPLTAYTYEDCTATVSVDGGPAIPLAFSGLHPIETVALKPARSRDIPLVARTLQDWNVPVTSQLYWPPMFMPGRRARLT